MSTERQPRAHIQHRVPVVSDGMPVVLEAVPVVPDGLVTACLAVLGSADPAASVELEAELPRTQRQGRRLHQQLRKNAARWVVAAGQSASGLPVVLTSAEMLAALGCRDRAFYAWLRDGLLPGGMMQPGSVWRCAVDTFVRWLSTDAYWFEYAGGEAL